jgi:hypothetical protein
MHTIRNTSMSREFFVICKPLVAFILDSTLQAEHHTAQLEVSERRKSSLIGEAR